MKDVIEVITKFAAQAHEGQRRKFVDEPYINHPVRVMEICKEQRNELPVLAAALLHDVLEDTPINEEQIRNFLAGRMNDEQARQTLQLVIELTDIYTKSNYPQWNRRKRKSMEAGRLAGVSAEAQTIKYADIIDNSLGFADGEVDFAKKFLHECRALLERMNKGNRELHKRAMKIVSEKLGQLK